MALISFGALPCKKKKFDDSLGFDVFEIVRVRENAFELVSFLVRLRIYQHSGTMSQDESMCYENTDPVT